MVKTLVILSDLWGEKKSNWLVNYTHRLKNDFEIRYYDCRQLAGIDESVSDQDDLHEQFVEVGIDKAINELKRLEKDQIHMLAFSVGGVIAWEYGIETKNLASLYCASSTRLRYQNTKPDCEIELYFGSNDPFKPEMAWFDKMNVNCNIIRGKGHTFYTEGEFSAVLCRQLLKH